MQSRFPNMLFIGEAMKEAIATVEADGSLSNIVTRKFAGDVAPNTASYAHEAMMQFGIPGTINILTAVGPKGESFSDGVLADMEARGLNIHPSTQRVPEKELGMVINLKNPDGSPAKEKVRLYRSQSAYRELLKASTKQDLSDLSKGYTHIFVSAISLACIRERQNLLILIQDAKEHDPSTQIIVSTNLRPSTWRMPDNDDASGISADSDEWKLKAGKWLNRLVSLADTVFANFTDEATLRGCKTSEEVVESLRQLNLNAEIILTNDADPILASHKESGVQKTFNTLVHPAAKIVDTVGAGDSFAGTYVAARVVGYHIKEAIELGSLVASQVVGFDGALPAPEVSLSYGKRPTAPDVGRSIQNSRRLPASEITP